MKIIRNKILPPPGYVAISIGPFIFTRSKCLNELTVRHENIHWRQELELGIIGFYLWYVIEFILRFIVSGFKRKYSYHNISFEQEASYGDDIPRYLRTRKHYSWISYLKRNW